MKASLVAVLAGVLLLTPAALAAPRDSISLDGAWQSVQTKETGDTPPTEGWREFAVPGVFWGTAEEGSTYAWLRRDVTVPADWQDRRVFLNLMGARYDPHVYVDGTPIASRLGGWSPFEVEITDAVRSGATHRIEIRCQDWGATFVEGFTLPAGGWNDDNAKRGKVLAPIGGHIGFYGPWDRIELLARPRVYLTRHVVVPSVREGTLTLTGSVSQPADGLLVSAQVIEDGAPALTIRPSRVGADGSWRLSAAFPDAHYWSPEDPHLYGLRIVLAQGDRVADVLEQRFGFKEFWTDGPDFYLNGVKRHLLATSTWPPGRPESTEFVRNAIRFWKDGNCVAFRQHTQPWRKEWTELADEMGIMMIVEAAMWTDSGYHAYSDERFWDEYRDHLERMVWRDRNNASLVMWSLENEFLSVGNDRWFPDLEKRLAELGVFVKGLDPHHPIFYESDLDPGGVADVIGLHYPHELPNHADYPNTGDWLQERKDTEAGGGLLGTVSRDFYWDRKKPLYIGEYLWVPTRDHSPGTVFFGDEAYVDRGRYNVLAKSLAWYDQTIAYRRAGVSGLCPWTFSFPQGDRPREAPLFVQQRDAYVPVAAYLRDRDTRFFSGEEITRTFDVFNDSPVEKQLELRWQVEGTDEQGVETLTLPPAGYRALEIAVDLPRADGRREVGFTASLLADGEEVHSQAATFRVEPRRAIEAPDGLGLAVYDPDGIWADRLAAEGLRVLAMASIEALGEVDPGYNLLIVAPGALKEAEDTAGVTVVGGESPVAAGLADFIRRGGRVLVMEQETLSGLPLPGTLVDHASTMTFPLDPSHPVLAGIEAGDLKFWRGDNYVSRKEVRRPAAGGARTIVVSGGDRSLAQGPIVEMKAGSGTVLLLQALVGEKLGTEPAARQILQNALSCLARPAAPERFTVMVASDAEFVRQLLALGVNTPIAGVFAWPTNIDQWGLAVLHGGGDVPGEAAGKLLELMESGGTAYWHAPEPDAFAEVAAALGIEGVKIVPAQGPVTLLERDHPLLAGVSREDLYFSGPPKSWMRDADVDVTVVDRAVAPVGVGEDADRFEAELMELTGGIVAVIDDHHVRFATTGTGTAWVDIPKAGRYVVTVVASGTSAGGINPLCSVRVNDVQAGLVSVKPGEFGDYPVVADLPAGRVKLTVAFVNDQVVGGEDRNLDVDAVLVGREPWAAEGVEILTQPASLAVITVGKGRLVLDGVRWDTNERNRVRGGRYASALLANLGASFSLPKPEPTWVPWTAFEQVGEYPYFGKRNGEVSLFAGGAIAAPFECVDGGIYGVVVHGRSTPAAGEFARLEVSVDGEIVGEVEMASGSDRAFTVGTTAVAEGEHTLTARFTNDAQVGGQDRNVWIREIGFRRAE